MMMWVHGLAVVGVWWAACAVGVNGQLDGSFWWLNSTVFGSTTTPLPTPSPSPTSVYCECVPYYLCVDGVISTSGEGIIDIRFGGGRTSAPVTNVEQCPDVLNICCAPPGSATTPAPVTTTLPPNTPCDCIPFLECNDPNRIVSDGKGNISLALFDNSVSHSKCTGSFTVCCARETEPIHSCVCVEPELCDSDGYVVTDGSGLIDVRINTRSHPTTPTASGQCLSASTVCCQLPGESTTTIATPTEAPLPSCGKRNDAGVRVRVLGFKEGESQFGEFPWVAAILRSSGTPHRLTFVGGATLIHPSVALTAAHKIINEDISSLLVRVGEWDTQVETEPYPHQDLRVAKAVIHPEFNPSTLFNDVALLFLEGEATLASHINTLCLAKDVSEVDWSGCVISGWGVNAFDRGGQYQTIMKSLELPLVDSAQCQNNLRNTRLGRRFQLHPTFLCAGGEAGKDACKGDGGGPLACPRLAGEPGHYLLVGATAWGVGCGTAGVPGVYVNIPALHTWITDTLGQHLTGNQQIGGGAGGGGRRNQERREQRQREREAKQNERQERQRLREERQRQREERQRQREERRRERQQGR